MYLEVMGFKYKVYSDTLCVYLKRREDPNWNRNWNTKQMIAPIGTSVLIWKVDQNISNSQIWNVVKLLRSTVPA